MKFVEIDCCFVVSFLMLLVPPYKDLGSCQSTTSATEFNRSVCVCVELLKRSKTCTSITTAAYTYLFMNL